MNVVDVILVLAALGAAYQGARVGAVVQVCAILGFLGGLYVGALLASVTVRWAHAPTARTAVALTTMVGMAFALGMIGRVLGGLLVERVRPGLVSSMDAVLGTVVAVIAALVTFWLLASTLVNSSSAALDSAILQSRIIRSLDDVLPAPPSVFSQAQGFLTSEGFPPVFAALAPASALPVSLPPDSALRAAVDTASPSTVKIEGYGCGVIQEGSGFVAAPGLVVTNAHVVAGIAQPLVKVGNSIKTTQVVLFDPTFDLAVLRVSGLTAPALTLDPGTVGRGAQAAVLGYPEGGPFTVDPAGVMALFEAQGRDIYGQGLNLRNIYEIDALVRPGNSGGPLVLPDGQVVGVVFSRSTTDQDIGYALASPAVLTRVEEAVTATHTVGTGPCTSD
ncbi:MAG: MarP family serine protease [Acidimicrobiales bacterium]|jgi:S1-C subfamily serine protease